MRFLFLLAAAGALVASVRAQTAVQTVDLPALDRTKIAFQLDAQPATVIGPAQVPGGYFRSQNAVARLSEGRVALATMWGNSRLHVVDASGKVAAVGSFSPGVMQGSLQGICRTSDDRLLVLHSRSQFTVFNPTGAAELSGALPGEMTVLCPAGATSAWTRAQVPGAELRSGVETPHDPGVTSRRARMRVQLDRMTAAYRYADASTYPSEIPAFSDLRVDRNGRLWVRRYPRPLEKTQEWWVFTADAQYLGRVDMPAAFIVDEVGDDYVAGSYLVRKAARPESDAIEGSDYEVRVYRLRRG